MTTPTPTPVLEGVSGLPDWAPVIAVAIALAAYLTSVISSVVQRHRSNKIAANSVLISLQSDTVVNVNNAGESPVLDVQVKVDGHYIGSGLPVSIPSGASSPFTSNHSIVPAFPDSVIVSFVDARGRRWERTANEPAKKPHK